ncbi:MAG: RNA polymerase factor sigma-54 [Bacillota bacterium]
MSSALGNELIQSQQLTLTPKMIEELKVLQMSYIDLLQYIEVQMLENPLLEKEDDEPTDFEMLISDTGKEETNKNEYDDQMQKTDFTEYLCKPQTIRQYLLHQAGEFRISREIRKTVCYLIENINDDGYLCTSIDDASRILGISVEKVKKALKIVQKLEPTGVGARNLKECILLQLLRRRQLSDSIKAVVMNYLDLLAEKRFKAISQSLGLTLEEVENIHQIIKSTDPKPGLSYSQNTTSGYIKPELVVKKIGEKFIVLFSDDSTLNLKLSDYYRKLIRSNESSNETKKYIKSKISKAMEIINAVEQRKKTVLNVASCIIEYQEDFLRKGHMFLKPLTLKVVADKVGLHMSTVSRTVSQKYIQTPWGVYELKFFFSAQLNSNDDKAISANTIKKLIHDMIKNEDKSNPLSDEQIRNLLKKRSIDIARRTVAKYRGELDILSASLRKQTIS